MRNIIYTLYKTSVYLEEYTTRMYTSLSILTLIIFFKAFCANLNHKDVK